MADDLRKLLNYIVSNQVVHDDLVGIDLDASASDSGQDIETDKRRTVQRDIDRANSLSGPFSAALVRSNAQRGELALDDRDPTDNAEADALIEFLVAYDLASSRTEETEPMHYRYFISIDWDRLRAVANAAGIDLDRALAHDAG